MIRNFLITGQRNSGKTTLVNELLEMYHIDPAGYRTVPSKRYHSLTAYAMTDLLTGEQKDISKVVCGRIQGIEKTFSVFGVNCLKDALKSSKKTVVLDELGRFEKNCHIFLQCVNELLDSEKIILAVLKKESIPYLEQIKKRRDVLIFDLDTQDYYDVKKQLIQHLQLLWEGETKR